jgi:hypothetical protein
MNGGKTKTKKRMPRRISVGIGENTKTHVPASVVSSPSP